MKLLSTLALLLMLLVPYAAQGEDEPTGGEFIRIHAVGQLETGIVAIGGETTGVTLTVQGIVWELDLSTKPEFEKRAERLNGKQVEVKGALERRAGVETGDRWIVTVSHLKAAR